jgi:hypothetical protein
MIFGRIGSFECCIGRSWAGLTLGLVEARIRAEGKNVESSDNRRSGLLTAGGVLSIIAGAFEVIGVLTVVGLIVGGLVWGGFHPFPPMQWMPGARFGLYITPLLGILGLPALALGVVAIIGGISALRRKSFGLSLAGAICALPMIILGILAIIFVSLSRKEFESPKQIAGGEGQPESQPPGQ